MTISRLSCPKISAPSAVSAVNMLPQLRPKVLADVGSHRPDHVRVLEVRHPVQGGSLQQRLLPQSRP